MTMLKVANCPQCGRVYQKNLRSLCQECIGNLNQALEQCEAFLSGNRRATTEQLMDATGVSRRQITEFLKENRLLLKDYPNLTYPCSSCCAPIRQDHLCTPCRVQLVRDLNELKEQDAAKKVKTISFQIYR